MTSRLGAVVAALIGTFAAGCESSPKDVRVTSSPSGAYTLRVFGAGDWPRFWLAYRTVRAEVTATGFQVTLPLYAGDSMDSSFDVRFTDPVWVSDDVIRWPSRSPASLKSLNSVISVENHTNVTFPSIRVWYEDLIVLVRVASGADVSIPTSDWWGSEYPRVDIAAFDAGGRPLATASTDADLRAWRGPSASIRVVISEPDQISVSISPRQP